MLDSITSPDEKGEVSTSHEPEPGSCVAYASAKKRMDSSNPGARRPSRVLACEA